MHFSAASSLMNQISSKERDAETGLDYFGIGPLNKALAKLPL